MSRTAEERDAALALLAKRKEIHAKLTGSAYLPPDERELLQEQLSALNQAQPSSAEELARQVNERFEQDAKARQAKAGTTLDRDGKPLRWWKVVDDSDLEET